jgi:hypothetical protein
VIVLTQEELAGLTGKARPSAQARVLSHMEIPYKTRPDRTLAVLRIHVECMTTARSGAAGRLPSPPEPVLMP